MHNKTIFREYDIRGRYNIDFDDAFAYALGRAFAKFCLQENPAKNLKIALGKDARHSSTPLMDSLAQGLKDEGVKVLDLGLVTSPLTYFACFHIEDLDGAIMITGSHNPPDYNGFKISYGKTTLTSEKIKVLEKLVDNLTQEDKKLGSIESYDIKSPYLERLKKEFSFEGLNFIADCGNGAAGSIARSAFEVCGLNPHILFEEPDGDFPNHHPDPTLEENLVDLKKAIAEKDASFGVGYDGDADRIVIVSEKGKTVYADELMSIYAKYVLEEHPGAQIVADVKCSEEYFTLLKKWGADAIMWKTGHSLIKQKVKELKSPFGGEFSGHIFFNDRFYGFDDAIYCTLRFIEILEKSKKSVSELLEEFPTTFSTNEIRIEVGEKEKYELVEKYINEILPQAKSINKLDGARVTFENGWALVRVSNTQPSVTLRFEAQSQEALNRILEVSQKVLRLEF